MSPGWRARGFTLLEIMLAFVLLAGAMGLLIGMLSGGLRQVNDGRSETEASLYAQSFLDELGVLTPIRPGRDEGEFGDGRYRYSLTIAEAEDPMPPPASAGAGGASTGEPKADMPPAFGDRQPRLYSVRLQVRWADGGPGRRLDIATLRYRIPVDEEGGGK